jgi:hypothetical protein
MDWSLGRRVAAPPPGYLSQSSMETLMLLQDVCAPDGTVEVLAFIFVLIPDAAKETLL